MKSKFYLDLLIFIANLLKIFQNSAQIHIYNQKAIQKTKKDIILYIIDIIILKTGKFFYTLIVILSILLFLIYFNAKYLINLEINVLSCASSRNLFQKRLEIENCGLFLTKNY